MTATGFRNTLKKLRQKVLAIPMGDNFEAKHEVSRYLQTLVWEDKRVWKVCDFLGDLKQAEQVVESRIQECLDEIDTVLDLGEVMEAGMGHYKQGHLHMALAHYRRALEIIKARSPQLEDIAPVVIFFLNTSALCLLQLKDSALLAERARGYIEKALTVAQEAKEQAGVDTDRSQLYYRRGLAYEKEERYREAADDVKRAAIEATRVKLSVKEQHHFRDELARVKRLISSASAL